MDVAKEAGVSAITVSRALRTPKAVKPATRDKVNLAVAKLNYVPDSAASSLASLRSNVVGVMVPSVTNTVFSDTLRGIFEVAEGTGVQIQIANTRYDQAEEERLLRVFLSQHPAALIVTGIDQSETVSGILRNLNCPLVQITETGPDPYDMMVGFDHKSAARLATEHLIAQGYKRPAFLGARQDPRSIRRLEGFRDAASKHGVFDEKRVLFSPVASSPTLGANQLRDLLRADPDADAALCNNDDLALGILFECQRLGMNVPNRFGICGFNDLDMMATAYPSLTSVRTPRYEVGRRAMEAVQMRLAGKTPEALTSKLDVELMRRDSTRRTG